MKEKMGEKETFFFHFYYKYSNILMKFSISNHTKKIFQEFLKN